jgi:hypothetical protein
VRYLMNRVQQTAPQIERLTQVTIIDPRHPLYGKTFSYTPRGKTTISIQLPDGQRRVIPRSATNLAGEEHQVTSSLPKISIRTILPVAQLVKAKLATEENQDERSRTTGRNGSDIREASLAQHADPDIMGANEPSAAKAPGTTLGTALEADATTPGSGKGGAEC